jgi:putative hydrolase of the HAD superfamily
MLFVPADLGAAKPAAQAFRGACEQLGVAPEQTLFVGDDIEAEARGSSRAGLRGVWLNRTHAESPFTDDESIIEITSLAEIEGVLNGELVSFTGLSS